MEGHEDSEGGVVHGFFYEGSEPEGISLRVNSLSIFDLQGDTPLSDGEDKVYFRFYAPFRKVSQLQTRDIS
jgi:hypothetical protein